MDQLNTLIYIVISPFILAFWLVVLGVGPEREHIQFCLYYREMGKLCVCVLIIYIIIIACFISIWIKWFE